MAHNTSTFGKIVTLLTDVAAGIAVFGVLVVVLLQVSSRLLGVPVSWTEEATRYLFVWMIFLGLSAGFRTVETARVTVFIGAVPGLFRRLAVPIYVVSSVLFFILTGWTGITLVKQQLMMNETAATLAIPMWIIGIIMPVSAVLAILAIIESLRTRRDLIALPEDGFPAIRTEDADVVTNAGKPS
ncbi:TRAP transporter small permease [Mesorhizobium sp. CGMCC 1.15528]|uniref:TRAP transporter small permease protein n=1 Tax=Mesorhizobium zhangyense TaxID=1776730 RepID=A0A7C9R939_9HYPH|nr:TRAP transporter small permease [Mesorhizobium zhangyense]NGN42896.1 TRAP transporter small permease [Mesorhizobium zhangyense]